MSFKWVLANILQITGDSFCYFWILRCMRTKRAISRQSGWSQLTSVGLYFMNWSRICFIAEYNDGIPSFYFISQIWNRKFEQNIVCGGQDWNSRHVYDPIKIFLAWRHACSINIVFSKSFCGALISYAQLLAIRQFCLHNKCLLRPHKLSQFPRILVQNFLIGSIFAFQKRVFWKFSGSNFSWFFACVRRKVTDSDGHFAKEEGRFYDIGNYCKPFIWFCN